MTKYLFLLFDDESWYDDADADPAKFAAEMQLHQAFCDAVAVAGAQIVGGEALQRSSTATVVRPAGGRPSAPDRADASAPLLTDGPFIETKEALGGFYIVDATDLDQALALAALVPSQIIEVRPVMEFDDDNTPVQT